MNRIAIIGCGGAGKSTLARQLGHILGIEVFHLDRLFWRPGWVPTPPGEQDAIQAELVTRGRWIIDGYYGRTLDVRLRAADTVIFLDYPTWLCLWRVLKRQVRYRGRSRPDMGEGCPERVEWEFLMWIWTYRLTRRRRVLAKLRQHETGKTVHILTSPLHAARLLRRCQAVAEETGA